MKRCLALLFFSVMVCLSGYAQKGRQGVGINGGLPYFLDQKNFGWNVGLKYENFLTDYIRLAPSIEYHEHEQLGYARDGYNQFRAFSFKAKSDFFLLSPEKRVRPYLHAGMGFVRGDDEYKGDNFNDFNLAAGVGLDWRIAYAISMQFEAAYDFAMEKEKYGHIDLSLGLTYYFK